MDNIQQTVKEKSRVTKEEWREYTKTVWHIANTSSATHPAVFPIEIPKRLIKLFSFYGESVLDPFAGIGTTAEAAILLGRKAVCVDQSNAYVNVMRRTFGQRRIDGISSNQDVHIVHGDSRSIDFLEKDEIDLIVTSPPYWNKANYGGEKTDLGSISSYRQFLDAIRPAFEECYRVLKPGRKMCVVTANVNQHTDHGLLTFPLAADFSMLLRDIGFVMINEIVWSKDGTGGKWGSYGVQRPIFGSYPYPPNFLFKNVHEYILVFAKPNGRPVKGPKVIPYDYLMDPRKGSRRAAGRMSSPSRSREQGKKALSFD